MFVLVAYPSENVPFVSAILKEEKNKRKHRMFFYVLVQNNHSILFAKYLLSLNNVCSIGLLCQIISINLQIPKEDTFYFYIFIWPRVRLRKCG